MVVPICFRRIINQYDLRPKTYTLNLHPIKQRSSKLSTLNPGLFNLHKHSVRSVPGAAILYIYTYICYRPFHPYKLLKSHIDLIGVFTLIAAVVIGAGRSKCSSGIHSAQTASWWVQLQYVIPHLDYKVLWWQRVFYSWVGVGIPIGREFAWVRVNLREFRHERTLQGSPRVSLREFAWIWDYLAAAVRYSVHNRCSRLWSGSFRALFDAMG